MYRVPLCLLLSNLLLLVGCDKSNNPATTPPRNVGATEVKLTIDSGEPKVTTVKVPFQEKMTVRDLLQAAESQGVASVYEGQGEGAMVKSIQGISNQGGGETAKNWIFYVNGKQATISSAVYSIQPGDAIIWRFEKFE